MNPAPLVTVGIASYNNAKYVIETLNSVVAQTYRNIELIVVDDFSTDDSVAVITGFLESCPLPSKFIPHEKNKGVVEVCNSLLREVKGEYYCFVGSDDVFYPEKVATQVNVITGNSADLVFSAMDYIGPSGEPLEMKNFNHLPEKAGAFVLTWAFLLGGSFITAPTVMIRTSIAKKAGGYDTRYTIEDMPLWVKLAELGAVMNYIDRPLVKYRVYSASLSSKLPTLISHARIVASVSKHLSVEDRKYVRQFIWYRIVSTNDAKTVIPSMPAVDLLFWVCRLNQTRVGHYLLYKLLNKKVNRKSFKQRLEVIKRQRVFSSGGKEGGK